MSDQMHVDTGARALHSLPSDEADDFDAHLSDCDPCSEELAGFLETMALLGAAAAEEPPARLHDRVMRQIGVTAQLPPLLTAPASRPATQDGTGQSDVGTGEREIGSVTPIRRWYRRPTTLLAAAAAAAVLIAGGVIVGTQGGPGDPLLALQQCVQSAPDSQVIEPKVGSGGQVKISASCQAAIVDIGPLPSVPAGKGYQLWVMAGTQTRSVGMVQAGTDRLQSIFITPLHTGDTDIGISLEPAAGSPAPTTSPMWVVPLPA